MCLEGMKSLRLQLRIRQHFDHCTDEKERSVMDSTTGTFVLAVILFGALCVWAFSRNRDTSQPKSPSKAEPIKPRPSMPEPDSAPVLQVSDADGRAAQSVSITHTPFSIGRHSESDLRLGVGGEALVSRRHLQFVKENGLWYALDAGSAHGVFVNGRRVSAELVVHGDRIEVGPYQLTFVEPGKSQSGRPSSRPSGPKADPALLEDMVKIGQGGMAIVYRARVVSSGNIVAVKVPDIRQYEDPTTVIERFSREVAITRSLKHPNIVSVYNHGIFPNGTPFLTMEFLSGGSLRQRVRPGVLMAERDARSIGAQVASALSGAHRADVLHRDIKPENVLFDETGNAKITDFGIAWMKGCRRMTGIGTQLGTAHYMSPEQISSRDLTHASDLYSLGCMLYEMTAGRCPFEGTEQVVMNQHITQRPEPVGSLNPHLSSGMQQLITELLEKDPSRRPSGADRVCQQLMARN